MVKFIKKQIEKHPKLWEIFKFLLIGGIATILDFGAMALTLYAWDPALYNHNFFDVLFGNKDTAVWAAVVGTGVGFMTGLVFNYIFSVLFVFTSADNSTAKAKTKTGFVLFTVFSVLGLLIHIGGMALWVGVIKQNEWIAKIILTAIVLVFNYITRKKFVFNRGKELPAQDSK